MHRTRGDRGYYAIDLTIKGYGRFRMSSQTPRARVAERRIATARRLAENGQFGTLRALAAGDLVWAQIEEADKQGRLNDPALLSDLRVNAPLWPAITATLPKMGKASATRARYQVALKQLRTVGFGDSAKVSDLACDDWPERLAAWTVSPATKNGLRRAVSRFLSKYLGKKAHPFRAMVLDADVWPVLKERKRMRGFGIDTFWLLMAKVPAPLVPSYVTLAASGMRAGEYLYQGITLNRSQHLIETVGKTGPVSYAVDPALWSYVEAAVPCRVARSKSVPRTIQNDARYKKLYRRLREAGAACGVTVTLHDLRRLYVRTGVAALGETATQTAVGHETASMTREYARHDTRASVAAVVGAALTSAQPKPKRKRA